MAAQTDVSPPRYVLTPDLASALQASANQCAALGCDGVSTKYWWQTGTTSDGRGIVYLCNQSNPHQCDVTTTLPPSDVFPSGVTSGLNPTQTAEIVGAPDMTLGSAVVDMTSTADQPITIFFPNAAQYYIIDRVIVTNCHSTPGTGVTLTGATGGIYTQPNKTGAPVMPAAQTFTNLTAPGLYGDYLSTWASSHQYAATTVYFSLTTGYATPPASCVITLFGHHMYQ